MLPNPLPLKCKNMAEDIKENAMSGGIPARLRGLDANGNSISPTVAEVTSAIPVATHSSKGIMSAEQAFYLSETAIIGGLAGGFPNRYKLIGILNRDAYAPFRVNISIGGYTSTDRYLIDATLTYYSSAMYVSGICYNRIGYVIKDNKAYVYLKEEAGNSYIGYVIGSEIHGFTRYESEPSNIVYVP